MKNCRRLEAVPYTTLIKSSVVFHAQNNKMKLRQGRCTR